MGSSCHLVATEGAGCPVSRPRRLLAYAVLDLGKLLELGQPLLSALPPRLGPEQGQGSFLTLQEERSIAPQTTRWCLFFWRKYLVQVGVCVGVRVGPVSYANFHLMNNSRSVNWSPSTSKPSQGLSYTCQAHGNCPPNTQEGLILGQGKKGPSSGPDPPGFVKRCHSHSAPSLRPAPLHPLGLPSPWRAWPLRSWPLTCPG